MDIKRLIYLVLILSCFGKFAWSWNCTFIYEYLGSFLYLVSIQEVVWFLSDRLDPVHSEQADVFIRGVSEFARLSQFVWTNRTDVRMIKIGSKRGSIAMVISTGAQDPVMYMHDRLMIGRHFGMSLVVYPYKVSDMKPIEELCFLLHRGNFVNSVVYFRTVDGVDNLFTFKHYPRFDLVNKTDYMRSFRAGQKRIASASQDVQGYKFYTPLKQDVPYVFTYVDHNGRKKIQGTSYRILAALMQSLNGTLVEYDEGLSSEKVIDMKRDVLDLVRSKDIEIAAHAYALFQTDDDVDKSYPLMVVKWCLMIPLRNSISTFLYTLQPFEWTVWFLVLATLMALCLLDFFWRRKATRPLAALWLNNYCHVLNIAPAYQVEIIGGRRFVYYAAVFWFGFFLSANYTSYLGSYLTVSVFRAQIDTIEDLVRAQLPVMIIDYELQFLLSEGYVPPKDFNTLLRAVDSATFYRHQMAMNASFAYFVTDDIWHFMHATQKHLKQKLFKFSDICFGSYHLAYPMQTDLAIWRDLEYFLFRIHSSGLFQMYESKALQYALTAGHIKRATETNEYSAAGLDHLAVMFGVLVLMYLIAIICLMLEMAGFWEERH